VVLLRKIVSVVWHGFVIMLYFLANGLQLQRYYELTAFSFKWRSSAILDFYKFEILTAGPVRGPICINLPNFVLIALTVADIWPLFDFSQWRPPAILHYLKFESLNIDRTFAEIWLIFYF